jgi:hypothetical protein
VKALVDNWEVVGDFAIRCLAQEGRVPAMKEMADWGREGHRAWVTATFEPFLGPLTKRQRDRAVDELSTALNPWVWKVMRREHGRSQTQTAEFMLGLVRSILAERCGVVEQIQEQSSIADKEKQTADERSNKA